MENLIHKVIFKKFPDEKFNINSLEKYNRYQKTQVNLRLVNGKYEYKNESFTETWDEVQLCDKAKKILKAFEEGAIGFIAYYKKQVIGFAYLGTNIFGSKKQYIELIMFHVSNEFRNKGIGRKLFNLICNEAKKISVEKLYISANSAMETQEAYKALGCVFAKEVQEEILEHAPFDVQLEYVL